MPFRLAENGVLQYAGHGLAAWPRGPGGWSAHTHTEWAEDLLTASKHSEATKHQSASIFAIRFLESRASWRDYALRRRYLPFRDSACQNGPTSTSYVKHN
eukprot:428919-Prymnesium_polylepis.1